MATLIAAALAVRPRPTLVFCDSTFDATDTDPYTFSARFIGRPDQNRTIIVAVHTEDAATNYSISSVTVGGIAATSAVSTGTSPAIKAALWTAPVPGGWSADIVVDLSEAITCCGVAIYAAYHLNSATPLSTTTSATDAASLTVTGQGDGIIIAASTNAAAGDTCTWTGVVTEQYDANATDIQMTGASAVSTIGGSHSPVADYVTGTSLQSVAAAFR